MAHTALPTSVRLGPIEYTVTVRDMDDLGRFDCNNSEISINETSEQQQQVLSLFHEVTHAILFEAGLKEFENEIIVNVVSAGMVSFMKNNPKVVELIQGCSKKSGKK